uniref:Cytochrome P450 n=1 Tax=Aureoumbra lagunensis TaxID=44058 RepID=A0A7S3NIN6_9STRA
MKDDFRMVWSGLALSSAVSIHLVWTLYKEKGFYFGWPILIIFVAVALTCWRQVYERYIRYGSWPSPRNTFPVLGNAVQIAPALIRYLVREARRHNGGLFLFWPGGPRPTCVIANARAAKEVLGASSTFPKGNDYTQKFGFVFGDGLVTSTGETHSRARRLLGRFFIKARLEKRSHELRAMVDTLLIQVLGSQFCGGATEITIDVQDIFHFMALQIFASAMLSIDMRIFATPQCPILGAPELRQERGTLMKCMRSGIQLATRLAEEEDNYAHPGEVMRWLAHEVSFGSELVGRHIVFGLPMSPTLFPTVRRLTASVKNTHAFFRQCIASRRQALAANGYKVQDTADDSNTKENLVPDDCLTALVKAADEGDESDLPRLTDTQICHQLVTLVSAGHDTTAFFLLLWLITIGSAS